MRIEQLLLELEFEKNEKEKNETTPRHCDYKNCREPILETEIIVIKGNSVYHRNCYDFHLDLKQKEKRKFYGREQQRY